MPTVRYTHLAEESPLKVGQKVRFGTFIGYLGKTGLSFGEHLHFDPILEKVRGVWQWKQIVSGQFNLDPLTLAKFINDDMFGEPLRISYFIDDPFYIQDMAKNGYPDYQHKGVDILPLDYNKNKKYGIYWSSRDLEGTVLSKCFHSGYGNNINIWGE